MLNSKNATGGRAGTTMWWSLPSVLAVALLALLWAAGPVLAHGEAFLAAEKIWPLLNEEQPEELDGVTMRIEHGDPGPWLIAENSTGETLEIQDANGEPFLRIGPEGVDYNRFAEEYYLTKWREQVPPEVRDNPEAEPEWVHLDDETTYRWLDRRIITMSMDVDQWVPLELRQAKEDGDVGEWNIPVRMGEAETEVRGTYRYDAPPKGAYLARLIAEPASPDVTVQLVHGTAGSADALSLQSRSEEPVTVLGRSGEPAIRIGPKEVQVNVNSPVGRVADIYSDSSLANGGVVEEEPPEIAQPEWKKVSDGSNFTWLDPRLRTSDDDDMIGPPDPLTAQEIGSWEIPMEVAGEEELLTGAIDWEPSVSDPTATNVDQGSTGISFGEIATVGAVTVVPALAIMALLLGPGLYKRYRYRQ